MGIIVELFINWKLFTNQNSKIYEIEIRNRPLAQCRKRRCVIGIKGSQDLQGRRQHLHSEFKLLVYILVFNFRLLVKIFLIEVYVFESHLIYK